MKMSEFLRPEHFLRANKYVEYIAIDLYPVLGELESIEFKWLLTTSCINYNHFYMVFSNYILYVSFDNLSVSYLIEHITPTTEIGSLIPFI